jgi:hypothetical protein
LKCKSKRCQVSGIRCQPRNKRLFPHT